MHTCNCLVVKFFHLLIRYVQVKQCWYVEMEFKDEEELRTDVKVYIILHMIVFYRWIIESIIKLTVIRT